MSANKQTVIIYHENWLLRKEGVKQWTEYWGVIRGKWLQFYEKSSEYNRPELRKTLELTPSTKCSLVKRNKHRFPFSIDNGNGVYYIKVETELKRYHWIFSILSAALGKPKRELPTEVPKSMIESESFRKLTKAEKLEMKKQQPPPPKKEPIRAADITNKRRRKYAERRENKVKKKEAARRKKLGLSSPPESDSDSEAKTEKHPETLRRAKNLNKLSNEAQLEQTHRQHRLEVGEKMFGNSQAPFKNSNDVLHIKAMVHPPVSKKSEFVPRLNTAFEEDEIEALPSVPVILEDNGLLPNMVLTEVSDSDEESTEEISLNSQTGLLMLDTSLGSQQDIVFESSGNENKNKTVMTRTIISDDGHVQQTMTTDERKSSSRPTSANRPKSALLERPISPLLTNPLSPLRSKNERATSPSSFVDVSSPKPVRNATQFSRFLTTTSSSTT